MWLQPMSLLFVCQADSGYVDTLPYKLPLGIFPEQRKLMSDAGKQSEMGSTV